MGGCVRSHSPGAYRRDGGALARLILDSGAVQALVCGNARVAAALQVARARGDDIVVPSVVVAQTVRGGAADAAIYRLLHTVHITFTGLRLARVAAALLGKTGLDDVADALIMAEALRNRPAVLLTGDLADMRLLAEGHSGITIVAV